MNIVKYTIIGLFLFVINITTAQINKELRFHDCQASFKNEVLTIGNSKISRKYKWNNGDLITQELSNKEAATDWNTLASAPDFDIPSENFKNTSGLIDMKIVESSELQKEHLQIEIISKTEQIELKRVFKIYPKCAVIACELYYKGSSAQKSWLNSNINMADMNNLENLISDNADNKPLPYFERITLPGKHWRMNSIEFFDVTDRFNNLVKENNFISYTNNLYRGNLLIASDLTSSSGLFILKEAPVSNVQLYYNGGDFMTNYGDIKVVGFGIDASDLTPNEWKRGYGFVVGVFHGESDNALYLLREYQNKIRPFVENRDNMILMNTWGDRNQDKCISEQFCLEELSIASKLGITHFQIDDGWQNGISSNSAFKNGNSNVSDIENYWEPHTEKFPNGLTPIVEKGKSLGIEVCLWFKPYRDNHYSTWKRDANVLINLHKKYAINIFKIDGVRLPNKIAEINFRKMLDKVMSETNYAVTFNLDITAGRRGGYFYLNEYGNLFLENRYTDWQNYYPYWTLRNLWMLSKYIPAQKLQIEFLNKWRNQEKYGDDIYAPSNYSFEYLFAITMVAQPLAWFEGQNLPKDALGISKLISQYKKIQHDFHNGDIFPIGNEPSGRSWTGFQVVRENDGYFMIFRENNESNKYLIENAILRNPMIKLTRIIGDGELKIGNNNALEVFLPKKNDFVIYKYTTTF